MSSIKDDTTNVSSQAFEYVAGTLRGDEREQFEKKLHDDPILQADVAFWEEKMAELTPNESRAPNSSTWLNIESKLNGESSRSMTNETPKNYLSWQAFWQWIAPSIAASVLLFAMFNFGQNTGLAPNTDYLAVLTDEAGEVVLTALTTENQKRMWLQWEGLKLEDNTNIQLWAVSKRDGEIRPITVFASTETLELTLDEARWRLVTDSKYLLLTEEEAGGSAIDEPSDVLLAKGVCVRFKPKA